MGVTAVRGAETPRYNPRMPSLLIVVDSIPNTELLDPPPPVCMRTLTKSSGWPTRTAHAPPTPPEMKDLSADSDFLAGASVASMVCGAGLVERAWTTTAVTGISVLDDVVDMLLLLIISLRVIFMMEMGCYS